MLEVKNLSFRYKKNSPSILNHISFHLKAGEILGILGKNGIGKTTMLRCITGELDNYTGSIQIAGREQKEYSINERSKILAIVSSDQLCYQNLRVADFLVTGFANKLAYLRTPNKNQYEQAYTVLDSMNQGKLFNASIFELSSGEMQIVKIVRAILQNPKIIVFDEPTSNLDVGNQLAILNQISQLSERGYTVITTTHNPGQMIELGGMVLLLSKEEYVYGKCDDVISSAGLSQIYDLNIELEHGKYREYAVCQDSLKMHKLVY